MSLDPREYLRHMLAEAAFIGTATAELTYERFLEDPTLQRAVVRSLEIIGEAARKVPSDFKARHAIVEWRAMAGMRDRLIHDYFGVDYDLVWSVTQDDVPGLRRQLERILEPK